MIHTEENGWLRSFIAVGILVLMTIPGSAAQGTVISIGDVVLDPGNSTTTPIRIYSATGVAGVAAVGLNLRYDPDVLNVTNVEQGDFTQFFPDNSNAADGWVTINTFVIGTQLTGDLTVAYMTIEAIGSSGDSSPLNLEIITMADQYAGELPRTIRNGTFGILGAAPVPPTPVPAFTTFGMLVITGLLCAIGVTTVRKKRKL
jgi:hypothetical protein